MFLAEKNRKPRVAQLKLMIKTTCKRSFLWFDTKLMTSVFTIAGKWVVNFHNEYND